MKGAIFDLDGTLIDSMGAWHAADVAFLTKRGLPQEAEYFEGLKAVPFKRAAEYTIERYGLYDENPEDIINEWRSFVRHEYDERIPAKPGALEYLRKLRAEGVRIAIATSSEEELCHGVLTRLGIDKLVDNITYTREVTRSKEFPDIYLLAAERLGVSPTDAVVFEDVLKCVRGAKSGGFRTVAVFDEESASIWELIRAEADRSIMSFEELASGSVKL